MTEFRFDAFVSYRRVDGSRHARGLRSWLRGYRLPKALRHYGKGRRLRVYLDRIYERAAEDFFEKTIKPALEDSRHLIVVATPEALTPRSDGSENWVAREVRYFLGLPQASNVSVAWARGSMGGALPADLHRQRPNIQWTDIRGLRWFGRSLWPGAWKANQEALQFVATLYDIPQEEMETLRREDANRRLFWSALGGLVTTAVAALLAGLTAWALISRDDALVRERIARSYALALHAEAKAAISPDRALLQGIRALETAPTPPAERVLWSALGTARVEAVLQLGGSSGATAVQFFDSGDRFVVSSDARTMIVDAASGTTLHELPGSRGLLSKDESLIATVKDGHVLVHDVASGSERQRMSGAGGWNNERAVYLDSSRVVTKSGGSSGPRVWNVATGEPLFDLTSATQEFVTDVAVSSDGSLALVADNKGTAILWSVSDGRRLGSIRLGEQPIYVARFSPRGESFLLADALGLVAVYRSSDRSLRWEHRGHVSRVYDARFDRDGGRILTSTLDEGLKIWDATDGSVLMESFRLPDGRGAFAAEFSRDGERILAANYWNAYVVTTGNGAGSSTLGLTGHTDQLGPFAIAPDGRHAVTTSDDLTVRYWTLSPDQASWARRGHGGADVGQVLWLSRHRQVVSGAANGSVWLWNKSDGNGEEIWSGSGEWIMSLAESPDGSRFAAVSHDGTGKIWDADTAEQVSSLVGPGGPIDEVVFTDDQNVLLVCRSGAVRLHEASTGRPLRELAPELAQAVSASVRPTSGEVFIVGKDGKIREWRLSTGELLPTPASGDKKWSRLRFSSDGRRKLWVGDDQSIHLGPADSWVPSAPLESERTGVTDVDFSPDGSRVVAATAGGVKVLSSETGKVLVPLPRPNMTARRARYSSDGAKIATLYPDEVRLWDANEGMLIAAFEGLGFEPKSLSFEPDGDGLVVGAASGNVILFRLSANQLLCRAKARARIVRESLSVLRWEDLWTFGPAAEDAFVDSDIQLDEQHCSATPEDGNQ